jgi:purine-binding chemotaxis protein CheW
MSTGNTEIFCFKLDNKQIAIPLANVDQVLMAVEVLPVPDSPQLIYGLIDYHGKIIPVVNLRHKLQLPEQPIRSSDVFVIADTAIRKIALVADEAKGVVVPVIKDLAAAGDIGYGLNVEGFLRCDDGIIMIYDIEKFLSEDDEIYLNQVIENQIIKHE